MANPKDKSQTSNDNKKYSAAYWGTEIQDALKRHQAVFFKEAEESIRVYNTRFKMENVQRRVNVWWYVVNTLLPAFYSSTPKAEVNLRKYAGTDIFDLSAVLLERNVQNSMDVDFDFDFVGFNSALQWLLTGRGILWARLDTEYGQAKDVPLTAGSGGLYLPDGTLYDGDPAEVDDTGGNFSYSLQSITNQKAILESVQYCDYLNSDARNEEEICWRARRAYLTEEEAKENGFDIKALKFDSFPDKSRDAKVQTNEHNSQNGKAELWELWSEDQNKVFWVQAKGKKSILESGDVPIKYAGFYPCSVINSSIDPDSTIPTSDYSHAKDQILEVERLAERKHGMIQAVRANGAFDATMAELKDMFTGDLKMTPVKNWPSRQQRGGTQGAIEYLDITPYINALSVLSEQLDSAKQSLFQMLRVSDLLQGVSDPRKTATANRLENAWSSLGVIVRQNQFAKFVGDGIEKLATVIASQFDPQRLLDNGDARSLLKDLVTPEMPYEMLCEQIVEPLKNNQELFKLEITSDSMVALDQRQERQDTADLLNSAGGFFSQMKDFVVEYPSMAPLSVKLFEKMIRSYKGGKEIEAVFVKTINDIAIQAEQKQQAAANQPPDPRLLAEQNKMQIAQMDSQSKMQESQAQFQLETTKQQMAQQQQQFDQWLEQQRFSLEQWKAQHESMNSSEDIKIKANQVNVDLLKVQATTNIAAANQEIVKEQTRLSAIIDAQRLELDKHKAEYQALHDAVGQVRAHIEHKDTHLATLHGIEASKEIAADKAALGPSPTNNKPSSKAKK